MRHRGLIAALLVLGLALFVLPANAGKQAPASVSTTITVVGTCSFEVTYAWSGFSGTGLQAELVLASKERGGLNLIHAWIFVSDQAGASGSASATFTSTGTPTTHQYFGFGQLLKVGRNDPTRATMVKNSYAASDSLAPESCGPDVSVS